LSVELPPDRHIFDLLRCEEADAEPTGGRHSVRLFLPRDDVACLAVLPRKLTVVAAGDRLQIRTSGADADSRVAVCGRDGGEIASRPLTDGQAEIRLGPAQGQGLCVKLYRGGQLEDAVAGW